MHLRSLNIILVYKVVLFLLPILFVEVTSKKNLISEGSSNETSDEYVLTINSSDIQTLWIEQKLDHFDDNENRTWEMRYMCRNEFFVANGPIFIYVDGEGTTSADYLMNGHVPDMAEEEHALLLLTEHRFYGESQPTGDITVESLKYLNVKQALADLAHLIRTIKATVPGAANSKVVLFGCSYAGAVVTWFKKLYPDLVVGCWASSAPLLFKMDFFEYLEESYKTIRQLGGEDCYKRIENAVSEIDSMFRKKRSDEIEDMLKICKTFDDGNDYDIFTLYNEMSIVIGGIAQDHNNNTIQISCEKIMQGGYDLHGVVNFILEQYEEDCRKKNETNDTDWDNGHDEYCERGCADMSFEYGIDDAMNETSNDNAYRVWTYQSCNEFGIFQTLDSAKQPFGNRSDLKYHIEECKMIFGEKYTEEYIRKQIQATNGYFGGLEPNVENVYFTYGELDPWRVLGIQDRSRATIIPMYSHCSDLDSISETDTPEMRAAKERIAQLVREWIGKSEK